MAEEFISTLFARGVRCVAFDMDLTMIRQHSRGCMTKAALTEFAALVSPDFLEIVPLLHEKGFKLAIATHSDVAEYDDARGIIPDTHLLGADLASACLKLCVPELADEFLIIGYNPWKRKTSKEFPGKSFHVREICDKFRLQPSEVILFDDVQENVDATECVTVKVDPDVGFALRDIAFIDSSRSPVPIKISEEK